MLCVLHQEGIEPSYTRVSRSPTTSDVSYPTVNLVQKTRLTVQKVRTEGSCLN